MKFEYNIDKNSEIAKNLKGHLLLVTGDIDNNVHPANTYRVADALIKANKRFDMFIMPGQRHGYGDDGRLLLLAARRLLREAPARPGVRERGPDRAVARDAAGGRQAAAGRRGDGQGRAGAVGDRG